MIGVSSVSPKGDREAVFLLCKNRLLSECCWQNPPFLQSGTKCGYHGDHPVLCVLREGQAFRPHLQDGLQTFQTGQLDTTACDTHQHRHIHVCVSSFSCSQVRMSDSLGLLSQILETDRFALVVQEPQQSNTKLSFSAEWWFPFVVEEKETSMPFYSVCLLSSIPDKSQGSAHQEKMLSVVTAMELLSYITADREQGRSSCDHLPDTTTPSTPPRS